MCNTKCTSSVLIGRFWSISMELVLKIFMTISREHAIIIRDALFYFRCTVTWDHDFQNFWVSIQVHCNCTLVLQDSPNQAVCDLCNCFNEITLFLVSLSVFESHYLFANNPTFNFLQMSVPCYWNLKYILIQTCWLHLFQYICFNFAIARRHEVVRKETL